MQNLLDEFQYDDLPSETSFRVAEILPGLEDDPLAVQLHHVDWSDPPEYETISYAWGDPNAKTVVICDGKRLEVTQSLHRGLNHLRFQDRSGFLWADALCINQANIPERGHQVRQMQKIYQRAKAVLIWVGPDTLNHQAKAAIHSIIEISNFICQRVGVSVSDLSLIDDVYQEVIFKNRDKLPLPNACEFSTEATWKPLRWLYSHGYFSRLWAIQEVNANKIRPLHCGHEIVEWDRVALVAGYIIMETAFSKTFGFTDTYCWWAALMSTERFSCPKNWGLDEHLLDPNYTKSQIDVYRDSVEAAFMSFENTDVLTYVTGTEENPSWIPLWNRPMLFRNPFRFGKALPWKPAGETKSTWSIDKDLNILHLTGFIIDRIKRFEIYDESIFSNAMTEFDEGRNTLKEVWERILKTVETDYDGQTPFNDSVLTAIATSFSFGLDEKSNPAVERSLLYNFIAYLKIALGGATYDKYVPSELSEESKNADGSAFGKPVWYFKYPQSSFFITESGLMGCCISQVKPGDVVSVALGSSYPFILRSNGDDRFTLRRYTFVHGIMHGERQDIERQVFNIC